MTDIEDHDTSAESANEAPAPKRVRFDPRRAIIFTLGAFVLVLAIAVIAAFISASNSEEKTSGADVETLQLGADPGSFTATTLPPAGLVDMDGAVTDLAGMVDGKPTMLNMFSSACIACRTEMPALERLHQAAGDDLQVVGVNLGDSPDITAKFVKQTGVTYPIVRDPNLLLVGAFNITAQPMSVWVDANGKIAGHRYGELSDAEMRVATEDYLGIVVPKS